MASGPFGNLVTTKHLFSRVMEENCEWQRTQYCVVI